jgi:hypothetical protein
MLISSEKFKHKGVTRNTERKCLTVVTRAPPDKRKGAMKHWLDYLTVKVKIERLDCILIIL